MPGNSEIVATPANDFALDARNPAPAWASAAEIKFSRDWQGRNPDSARETSVRALWSGRNLFLRFECRYRELFVFADSAPDGRRDQLWDRDVVEAFLQPDPSRARYYKEFEIAPNGLWIDLDIFPGGRSDPRTGLQRSVFLDEEHGLWTAELAIPLQSLSENFDPRTVWRANFFRVEGAAEPRAYLAWQPTHTPEPNFHVPGAFGRLRFAP